MRRRECLRAVGGAAAAATAGCSRLVGPDVAVQVEAPAASDAGQPMDLQLSPVVDDVDVRVRLSATDVRDVEFAVAGDGAVAGPAEEKSPVASAITRTNSDPAADFPAADATGALRMPPASLARRRDGEGDPTFVAFGASGALDAVQVDVTVPTDGQRTDGATVTRRLTDPEVSSRPVDATDLGGAPVPNARAAADGFVRALDTLELGRRG